jgi:hypothetical protein
LERKRAKLFFCSGSSPPTFWQWRLTSFIYVMFLLSLEVSTLETNRDREFLICWDVLFQRCRDFLNSQDVLFQSVEIESLDRDKDKNWDKSRLYSIDFVKICQDVIFQTVENFLTVEMSFLKVLRKSQMSRLNFSKCWDWDHIETNPDPQA